MKRDKLDAVFSNLVRERANYICQECGMGYRQKTQGLHCSHLWSRARASCRYTPDAAVAHCYSCHQRLSGNPVKFAERIREYLGDRFCFMRRAANSTVKLTKLEKEDIYQFYKKELKRIRELRKSGHEGRIEFDIPPILDLKLREAVARMQ